MQQLDHDEGIANKLNLPLLKKIQDERIFSFYSSKGKLMISEECDDWFCMSLNKLQLLQLADEIKQISESEFCHD